MGGFGPFKFIDYGPPQQIMSAGLKDTFDEIVNTSQIPTCNGKRNVMVLYGGSGAGKTKNTEAILAGLDVVFPKNGTFKRFLGITEIISIALTKGGVGKYAKGYYPEIGAINLMRESDEKKSCATGLLKKREIHNWRYRS